MADDDIRVHITNDDIESACQAWLEAIAEGHVVARVAERHHIWLALSGVRARQTLDDLRARNTDERLPFARPQGDSLT